MSEQWRAIPGFKIYEASDLGRVRSIPRVVSNGRRAGVVLAQPLNRRGYFTVTLHSIIGGGGLKTRLVHQVVLEAFRGLRPAGHEGCHNNGVKTDNALTNLRWDTPENNQRDSRIHGAYHWSKLVDNDVAVICRLHIDGWSLQRIADRFKTGIGPIQMVLRGNNLKHVARPVGFVYQRNRTRGFYFKLRNAALNQVATIPDDEYYGPVG